MNAGESVPLLIERLARSALASRVTMIVYVFIVTPSAAVTVAVMVFAPATRLLPPRMTTDAFASAGVAAGETFVTLLGTVAV